MKQSILSKLRRLMALSLALLLIISLTGCFKKDNPDTPDSTEDQSQTDPTNGAASTEEPTDAPTEAPTEPPVQTVMGTISANNLNVRSNPSKEGSTVLSQLPVNQRVEILEQTTETTSNGSTVWGRIGEMTLINGKTIVGGWIDMHYVQLDGQTAADPTEPSSGNVSTGTGKKGTITATELNIRKDTSTDAERVGLYVKGDEVFTKYGSSAVYKKPNYNSPITGVCLPAYRSFVVLDVKDDFIQIEYNGEKVWSTSWNFQPDYGDC